MCQDFCSWGIARLGPARGRTGPRYFETKTGAAAPSGTSVGMRSGPQVWHRKLLW